jgi:hypothetical protein
VAASDGGTSSADGGTTNDEVLSGGCRVGTRPAPGLLLAGLLAGLLLAGLLLGGRPRRRAAVGRRRG